jgi:ankyrin repeat protein
LMSAAWQGQTETLKVLLASGADRTLQDGRGKRAIDWAREAGHLLIVELLEARSP